MSEDVLQNMQKHLKRETIENALKISYECGVGTSGNLIFGAENETFETVWESLCWNRNHVKKYHQQPIKAFTYIQTYPGSKYYHNAVEKGLIKNEAEFIKKGQWILNITQMSDRNYGIIGEVGRLLQYEKCPEGKLLSLEEQTDTRLTVTFRCPHCGSVHTYHNLSRRHLSEKVIRSLGCRTCNSMADYPIYEQYQPYDHYYMVDWLLEKLDITDMQLFQQSIVSELLRCSCKDRISVGILGSGYAAAKLVEILRVAGKELIEIDWILQRKELNAISQDMNVIKRKEDINPVSVVVNTELTQPEWSSRFFRFGDTSVDLEHLIRVAAGCHSI
jgi:transcription elongation factor Elf1